MPRECPEGNTLSWKVPAQVKGENKGTQKHLMAEWKDFALAGQR